MSGDQLILPVQLAQLANVEKVAQTLQSQPVVQQQAAQVAAAAMFKEQKDQIAGGTEIKKDRAIRSRKEHESHQQPQFANSRQRKKAEQKVEPKPETDCAPADSESEIWTGNILNMQV